MSGRCRPANCQTINAKCWLANTHGHTLAGFAACANATVEFKIIAHHRNFLECLRPRTNQNRPLDRTRQFTVLDDIGLGHREDEFA